MYILRFRFYCRQVDHRKPWGNSDHLRWKVQEFDIDVQGWTLYEFQERRIEWWDWPHQWWLWWHKRVRLLLPRLYLQCQKSFKAVGTKVSTVLADVGRIFDWPTVNELARYTLFVIEASGKRAWGFSSSIMMPGGGACLCEALLSFSSSSVGPWNFCE